MREGFYVVEEHCGGNIEKFQASINGMAKNEFFYIRKRDG
jgi:hypothetical protein